MKLLPSEYAIFRDLWKDLIWGKPLTLALFGKRDIFKINDDDDTDYLELCHFFKFSSRKSQWGLE